MADAKDALNEKKESITKLEFQHFIAEFEDFRDHILKKTFKLEQEMDRIKDCLNDLQDELKESKAIRRRVKKF